MLDWTSTAPTVLASFMASMVEFVEALTIVLAVGMVRGWRSALLGTGVALLLLVALVVTLGRSLAGIPLPVFQLVVGTLLILFGLRWLRKAVLRAAGVLPLHDEAQAFAKETAALRAQEGRLGAAVDKIAFITTFKAVVLEGIEVVFIVIAIGTSGRLLVPAALGAALALLVVVALGLWLHRPLAKVPENTLKFGVGVMLAAFGTFWVGEGIGLEWPGGDWVILVLIAAFLAIALALVRLCARVRRKESVGSITSAVSTPPQNAFLSIAKELVGLFIDDGWLAAGVVFWVLLAWFVETHYPLETGAACTVFAAGLAAVLALSAGRRAIAG